MAVGSFKLPIATSGDWTRPSDWLAMPTGITSANQTFVALHAIFESGQNYCAFRFTTSAGQYQVDWGDGTIDLVNSNVIAQHDYNYTTYDVGNTTLSTRGYKQAIITVTAVSGNLLTCNFQLRFVTSPVQSQNYTTGFLDCILSMPNATASGIVFGGGTVSHRYVERVNFLTIGGCTSMSSMFNSCISLMSIPLFNTINVTNMGEAFRGCIVLESLPLFNTINVTTMGIMFQECRALKTVPLFNTASVTSMESMFFFCSSIQSIPLFNTINVTNMNSIFRGATSLQSVPLLNTSSVTNMFFMFLDCLSLKSIPFINTPLVTNMTGMFQNCQSIKTIPNLLTTSINTDFGNFANGCSSVNRIPMIFSRTVNISNCQLPQTALVEIFNNLVDRTLTTSANINITGNWGASALTAAERLIATAKNWTITG